MRVARPLSAGQPSGPFPLSAFLSAGTAGCADSLKAAPGSRVAGAVGGADRQLSRQTVAANLRP